MKRLLILFAFTTSLALPLPAHADLICKVINVIDGDTIAILYGDEKVKVRLAEIDAPEKDQSFGNKSKQALVTLVYGKEVRLVDQGQDKYRRTIGRVYQGDADVSAEQVGQGMAWVYRKYSKDLTLLPIEQKAREQKLGLWAGADPMAPWVWRRPKN